MELKYRVISSIILIVLDILWLKLYMTGKYLTLVRSIQGKNLEINIYYAIAAYVLMLVGLNIFVLSNIDINNINIKDCFTKGFMFGVVLYGVYNMTNGAIFGNWDAKIAISDILWGGFVYFASCYLLKYFKNKPVKYI